MIAPSPSAFTVPEGRSGALLDLLCERFPRIGREVWRDRCARGLVRTPAGRAYAEDAPCGPGTRVLYFRETEEEPPPAEPEGILFEDAHLLVADKPHGMAVTPAGPHLHQTLLYRLRAATGRPDLSPVHRLDRDTAGLVLFATDKGALSALSRLFHEGEVDKTYLALAAVPAFPDPARWSIANRLEPGEPWYAMRAVPGPANARTEIRLVDARDGFGRFEIRPATGKKHQIRVHMAGIGYPILHDPIYGGAEAGAPPLQLLAAALSFRHPYTGAEMTFRSRRELTG